MLDLKKERYLLALSGGSDSMYLFHQLLDGKYDFAVAHVDHGWRETSKEEALWLKEYCEARGITFYGHKLDRVLGEDEARRARLAFFRSIEGFDAVLMAHHADDQVETILKRLFEGSSNLRGMEREVVLDGVRIIRPLLHLFKQEMHVTDYIEDETNRDPAYLRSRMRESMIPYLEKLFGKGIKRNILAVSKRLTEGGESGPFGYWADHWHEGILRGWLKREGIVLPRGEVDKALLGKRVVKGEWEIVTEYGCLFMWRKVDIPIKKGVGHWRDVLKGEAKTMAEGVAGPPKLSEKMANGVVLSEWYRRYGVPVWMRGVVPVIWSEGKIVGECLTGREEIY